MLPERKLSIPFRQRWLPGKERAVTIAAGFICSDGVVLAADSQYTGVNRRDAAKIWHFGDTNVVAMAGAGDATLIRRAKYEIERQLTDAMSEHDILTMAQTVVRELLVDALAFDKESFLEVLLAIRTPSNGVALFENQRGVIFAPLEQSSQCIGSGG